jgi:hypothetical protein
MMEEKRRINVSVDHSEAVFFTDNVTVWHSPQKFVLDFMQASPRFDQIGEESQQTIAVKHKTLMMDPTMAKVFLGVLKENIDKYEKNIGKISLPKKVPVKHNTVTSAKIEKSTEATSKYIG